MSTLQNGLGMVVVVSLLNTSPRTPKPLHAVSSILNIWLSIKGGRGHSFLQVSQERRASREIGQIFLIDFAID